LIVELPALQAEGADRFNAIREACRSVAANLDDLLRFIMGVIPWSVPSGRCGDAALHGVAVFAGMLESHFLGFC